MEPTYSPVTDNLPSEEKREYWDVAFGLQAVDGLAPSRYMKTLAAEHVSGEKTYEEVATEVKTYYENTSTADQNEHEADEVSLAIQKILSDEAFNFSIITLKSYHERLFKNLPKEIYHPGEFRTVNLTKEEPVLNGETVQYANYTELEKTLEYDLAEEKTVDYLKLSDEEKVSRLAEFTSRIWQVHPFYEGNTRTTAVFIQKYLKNLGYDVNNELFKNHSLYFRNALVRANYSSIPRGIKSDPSWLEKFFKNLLFSENIPLDNQELKI